MSIPLSSLFVKYVLLHYITLNSDQILSLLFQIYSNPFTNIISPLMRQFCEKVAPPCGEHEIISMKVIGLKLKRSQAKAHNALFLRLKVKLTSSQLHFALLKHAHSSFCNVLGGGAESPEP